MPDIKTVCVVGSHGYVGSVLVPRLLKAGYHVKALDLMIYGEGTIAPHLNLEIIRGDIRDTTLLRKVLQNCDAVIHLACISNDSGYELNPELGKAINYTAFGPLVDIARDSGVRRLVYASSSSVYGIQDNPLVTEDLPLKPLTDYSKYKAECEPILLSKRCPGFEAVILRPATISGYSPRFRMDVIVNVLMLNALAARRIRVFGGTQMRANLFMADMVEAYIQSLSWPAELVDGETFNIGQENFIVSDLAEQIRDFVGPDVEIVTEPTNDRRSYSLCSDKIKRVLGFAPTHTLQDALVDLQAAYEQGKIVEPLENPRFYNVKWLQKVKFK